jgi:hypothetical protein
MESAAKEIVNFLLNNFPALLVGIASAVVTIWLRDARKRLQRLEKVLMKVVRCHAEHYPAETNKFLEDLEE